MLLSISLMACSGSTDTDDTDTHTDDTDTDTGTDTGATGTAETGTTETGTDRPDPPDAVALQASLQAALDAVAIVSIRPCFEAWRIASEDQQVGCPIYSLLGTTTQWDGKCVTDEGTQYQGILTTTFDQTDYVNTYLYEQVMVEDADEVVPGWTSSDTFVGDGRDGVGMDGTAAVRRFDDYMSFVFGGQSLGTTVSQDGLTLRHHKVEGLCETTVEIPGSWMSAGLEPWLRMSQLSPTSGGGYRTQVDGSMAGLPAPYSTISFESVTVRSVSLGSACELEPTGAVDLREDDGTYWRVEFDPEATCDGCGKLTQSGYDFGTLCGDFSMFLEPLAETDISDLLGPNARRTAPGPSSSELGPVLFQELEP